MIREAETYSVISMRARLRPRRQNIYSVLEGIETQASALRSGPKQLLGYRRGQVVSIVSVSRILGSRWALMSPCHKLPLMIDAGPPGSSQMMLLTNPTETEIAADLSPGVHPKSGEMSP